MEARSVPPSRLIRDMTPSAAPWKPPPGWSPPPGLFASLTRSDQRWMAEQYVRGLLEAEGRKTLRNVAAQIGGRTLQQSVHHFISASSWNWSPVRQALAQLAERLVRPRAWVVRSTVIPKAGAHSVGVEQRFVPHLGQTVNSQQAFGAWLASGRAAVPVNWHLVLPESRPEDPVRRGGAGLPDTDRFTTLEECASGVALEAAGSWGLQKRPVVVDVQGLDAGECVRRFDDAGVPLVLRIGGATRLRLDGGVLRGCSSREASAQQLVEGMKRLRRQIEWVDESGERIHRRWVSEVPVLVAVGPPDCADRPGGTPRLVPRLLVGGWETHRQGLSGMWLTDSRAFSLASVLRLTRLADVVERDFSEISERVGMRDFTGRSFRGWHRHTTLASVAHLTAVQEILRPSPARGPSAAGAALRGRFVS